MNQGKSSKFVPAIPADDDIDSPTNENTATNPDSINIYDGVAECAMNDSDNLKDVKLKAKDLAQDNVLKKISDYVDCFLKDRFLTFPDEEILSIANEIYHITDVKYDAVGSNDKILIRATVTAQVDNKDIMNCLIRFFKERTELKSQVESLRKENAEQKLQISELKRQLANNPQDKDVITQKFADKDKVFLSNQKFDEADKLYYKGDYNGTISILNEALELNPNLDLAYNNRGNAYSALGQYERAIQDYDKAIELNPNNAVTYQNRGKAYKKLGDKSKSKSDYKKAKELRKKG